MKVHPFSDGNGRTARLLLLFLFRKLGHTVWEHVSLEGEISHHREAYIQALQAEQLDWRERLPGPYVWCRYCLNITHGAYEKLRHTADNLVQLAEQAERVHTCLQGLPSPFGRQQVLEEAIGVDQRVIDLVLGSLVNRGLLRVARERGQAIWSW